MGSDSIESDDPGRTQEPRKSFKSEPIERLRKEKMARPERFELPTKWFEATYSIQLSYGRI